MKLELGTPHSKELLWNKALGLSIPFADSVLSVSSAASLGRKQQQRHYLQLLTFSHMSFCLGLTEASSEKNRYI